ncbi:CxC2 domain-containing protein [Mycena kentingensis (nom. inval.)]|nr:CxC2 domain-containing protein [Mycena kentingensis (nom. inval.)]
MPPIRNNQKAPPSTPTGSSNTFNLGQAFTTRETRSGARFSPFAIVLDNVDLESLYSRRLDEKARRKDQGADDVEVLPGEALPDEADNSEPRSPTKASPPPGFSRPFVFLADRPFSPIGPFYLRLSASNANAPAASSQTNFTSFPIATSSAPVPSYVETVSADNRRILREPLPIPPDSPIKRLRRAAAGDAPPLPTPLATDAPDEVPYTMSFWENEEEEKEAQPPPRKRKRAAVADESMSKWLEEYRDGYLDALLWLDGRGLHLNTTQCTECGSSHAEYRCTECHAYGLVCKRCVVTMHAYSPFHWVQKWTGTFYKRVPLKSLGLRVQLGHPVGEECPSRLLGPAEFLVLHRNGIHEVGVDFCGCHAHGQDSFPMQLLRARLYPATTERPQTCVTLDCLDDFHSSSLHTKSSAYDYYASLESLTDGSGCNRPPNRYKAFMRMARQYRHLLLLKRRGRGHALSGIKGTAAGELALRCPACPRPGINLPANWEDASPADRCLYVVYLALDACFRLKRRLMGSDIRDPGLGTGWAYFVEWEAYRAYLKTITTQKEMSTCSGLAALDHANTKFSRGYAATGVGAGICARHEYGNMDYILASLLRHIHARLRKVLSYDIACQWWKDLKERLEKLPPLVRLHLILSLTRFVVPKMHIIAHIVLCRLLFDLRLVPGSGQTDGEGIERLWASIAGLAASSKLSGHGARADLLDDHWSFWNWCKFVGLPALLRRRRDNARVQLQKQEESFAAFCVRQAENVPKWLKMVTDFEADGTMPNPYAAAEADGLTEKEVKDQMEAEEQEEASKGAIPIHAVTPSEFVAFGLELEEQQLELRRQIDRRLQREQELVEAGVLVEEALIAESEMDDMEQDGAEDSTLRKKAGTGEGRRTISWIWTLAGTTGSDAAIQDAGPKPLLKLFIDRVTWSLDDDMSEDDGQSPTEIVSQYLDVAEEEKAEIGLDTNIDSTRVLHKLRRLYDYTAAAAAHTQSSAKRLALVDAADKHLAGISAVSGTATRAATDALEELRAAERDVERISSAKTESAKKWPTRSLKPTKRTFKSSGCGDMLRAISAHNRAMAANKSLHATGLEKACEAGLKRAEEIGIPEVRTMHQYYGEYDEATFLEEGQLLESDVLRRR